MNTVLSTVEKHSVPRILQALVSLQLILGSAACSSPAVAQDPPPPPKHPTAEVEILSVPFGSSPLWLNLPKQLQSDLSKRRYRQAAEQLGKLSSSVPAAKAAEHAFLQAWCLARAGRAQQAVDLLELFEGTTRVPADYLNLTIGEIHLANGDTTAAATTLAEIPTSSRLYAQARVILARALKGKPAIGSTSYQGPQTAREVLTDLTNRADPAESSDEALWLLANEIGTKTEEAYPLLRRAWAFYPTTQWGKLAAKVLTQTGPFPTWTEIGTRGTRLMQAGKFKQASDLLSKHKSSVDSSSPEACQYWFALGRSLFRQNRVTEAERVLGPAGASCVGLDNDRGAKALYLAGKSLERKKAWAAAGKHYERIHQLYPTHSYADDGLILAGIALQEAGSLATAQALWTKQVSAYPEGDMSGEGFWRLAWSYWLEDDTEKAIHWADKAIEELTLKNDPVHYRGAKYWAARWRLYPHRGEPQKLETNALELALDQLEAICLDHPYSWYALLAAARLSELAPERFAKLPTTAPPSTSPESWSIRASIKKAEPVVRALSLYALGLSTEARMELARLKQPLNAPEAAWLNTYRSISGDWLGAHDALRSHLVKHPPENIGEQTTAVLATAYPDRWWSEVQKAAQSYQYDARTFHALVREESNFNAQIVSYAGARGLSQVMPATGKRVAAWLSIPFTRASLFDPQTNLNIGARYFHFLSDRYEGNPALSMAGYNAGEGNVGKWLTRWGNIPTDEFVESIPFRQTRHYVKRVSTTWQVYHRLEDNGSGFVDLSPWIHQAVPDSSP